MILGIGADLCAVERMDKSIRSPAFLRRVFSAEEQALLESRTGKARAETAAANWAAKEAFLKACGTGIGGFALAELAVLRRESGAPCFVLEGKAAAWAEEQHITPHLSLTHEGGMAGAFVVLEVRDD